MAHHQLEVGHEGAVDVVGQDHQVRPLRLHEVDQSLHRLRVERHRRRVARVDQEERLDGLVLERLQVVVGQLEAVLRLGGDIDRLERVVLEVRHLEVGGEDRRGEGDGVAGVEQPRVLQRLEDVAHGGGAALDRVEVELRARPVAGAHRPHQELVGDRLVVDERPVGDRVVVADDRVGQLVDELVRVEGEAGDGVVDHRLQRLGAGRVGVALALVEPGLQPLVAAVERRHAGEAGLLVVHDPLRLGQRELAEQEEGLAGAGRDPVRVAAAGVEVGPARGVGLGQAHQLVLDLERAEVGELPVEGGVVHRGPVLPRSCLRVRHTPPSAFERATYGYSLGR